jgi:aminoglycoside phosphotransferase
VSRSVISSTGLADDPMIASRDLLLDGDAVAERLGRMNHGGSAVESATLRRAKYRIGESLRVVYDVVVDGRTFVVSARTFAESATAFRQASVAAVPVGTMFGVAHDPQLQAVWWTVPNDRRLRNLGTLLDAPRRVRQASGVAWEHSALVEYAPERSATACIFGADGQVSGYAKAYSDRDTLDVADEYNHVATALMAIDGVKTPRALGWARPDRIVVLEPMTGLPWTQLSTAQQPAAMHRLGTALGHIHELRTDFGRGAFQRYRPDRVSNSAHLVAIARPDVADAVHRLSEQLSDGPPAPTSSVCLHGDVHANNILFDDDQVHMIDFDQGGSGAAAADLGSLLASLAVTRLLDPEASPGGLGTHLLAGYADVRPLPTMAELQWYTAAALVVERAIRAVNRVYRPTLAVLGDLVDLSRSTLSGQVAIDA